MVHRPISGPPRRHRRATWVLLIVGLLIVTGSAVGIQWTLFGDTKTTRGLTHTVRRGSLKVTITEQGTLESSNNTEIKCKVRGFNTVTWVIPSGTVVEPGDLLVQLDTKAGEEALSTAKTNVHEATATLARSTAKVARASISIPAYEQGEFQNLLLGMKQEVAEAKISLETALKLYQHTQSLFKRGFATELEVEGYGYSVTQAELELEVKETNLDVLERFTSKMQLKTLNGELKGGLSKMEADKASLAMNESRKRRAQEELANCTIRAKRGGLVIYPSAAAWKNSPDITEGASVRKDQVLLLMPDLTQMQIKVGIHETMIDRVHEGFPAHVTLPDQELDAEVSSVARVTKPARWWTGNVVKYDTVIKLPSASGLKPGMSAAIEIVLAEHSDVLTIPVASIIEAEKGYLCWVQTDLGIERRPIQIGDSNDEFTIVKAGLKEGDEVMLNPLSHIDEDEARALKALAKAPSKSTSQSSQSSVRKPQKASAGTSQ